MIECAASWNIRLAVFFMADFSQQRFLRAGTIARLIDLSPKVARRLVREGTFGEPRMMQGEWCAPADGYSRWVESCGTPAPRPRVGLFKRAA